MNHWPFVIAAYALAVGATLALAFQSYRAMRGAEMRAEVFREQS